MVGLLLLAGLALSGQVNAASAVVGVASAAPAVASGSPTISIPPASPTGTSACPSPATVAGTTNLYNADWLPTNWKTAYILPGDSVALNLWNSIKSNATCAIGSLAISDSADASALAMKPNVVNGYTPSFSGYPQSDPNCWWSNTLCTTPKQSYLPPDYKTCNEPSTWGLTVDDGPLPYHCHLYELYRENSIIPSLFYIGSNTQNNPGSAVEGLALGGPICVHTWSHNYTTSLTNEQVFAELYYTKLILKRVLGISPRCWRPPYGDVDDRVRTIAFALEMDTWIWDNDSNDWKLGSPNFPPATVQADVDKIIAGASNTHGTVVLDHELSVDIANVWISNYPKIKSAFTNVVSGHICNNVTAPYAEADGVRYPDFAAWKSGAKAIGNLNAVTNLSAQIVWSGVAANQKLPYVNPLLAASSSSSSAAPSSTPTLGSGVIGAAAPSSTISSSSKAPDQAGSASIISLSSALAALALAAAACLA